MHGYRTKVLSVGCGDARRERELVDLGYDVHAIDARTDLAMTGEAKPGLKVEIADARPFVARLAETSAAAPDGSSEPYDLVWCVGLLYHLGSSPAAFLADCARIAPRILIDTEIADDAAAALEWRGVKLPGRWRHETPKQVRAAAGDGESFWFTREGLSLALQAAGYEEAYQIMVPYDWHHPARATKHERPIVWAQRRDTGS